MEAAGLIVDAGFPMVIVDDRTEMGNIKVLFIAGFGPIVRDASVSRKLYKQILGIGFKEEDGDYLHTETTDIRKRCAVLRSDSPRTTRILNSARRLNFATKRYVRLGSNASRI